MDIRQFRDRLIEWYIDHKRDLPWRHTSDPYKIWMSEIILQQTRVAQGLSYYLAFIEAYPTVQDLAAASEDDVLSLWKGLGYYSRARNLHATAKYIIENHDGKFPDTYKDVLALKGVGKYTAAAICSFAYKMSYPVVDGNVIRVLSRLHAITDAVDSSQTLKQINEIAADHIDPDRPDTYNQSIMEFGALQCRPKSPDCMFCPMSEMCGAYNQGLVNEIPYKAKKIKRSSRYFHYIIATHDGQVLMQRRNDKDIWQGLHQFPLIETQNTDLVSESDICELLDGFAMGIDIEKTSEVQMQKLTHRDMHVRFYHVSCKELIKTTNEPYFLVYQKKVSNFALPKAIDAYIREVSI